MADQTYNRIKLATKLLDLALWFFLERQNFSSALKLAGAAEEAFRKALSSQEEFIGDENSAQLAVTRMVSASGRVTLDELQSAAIWAIVRACDNYNRLGLPRTARMLEFDNWFYENVVGCSYEEAIQA
jgi:hypothetical protein